MAWRSRDLMCQSRPVDFCFARWDGLKLLAGGGGGGGERFVDAVGAILRLRHGCSQSIGPFHTRDARRFTLVVAE